MLCHTKGRHFFVHRPIYSKEMKLFSCLFEFMGVFKPLSVKQFDVLSRTAALKLLLFWSFGRAC